MSVLSQGSGQFQQQLQPLVNDAISEGELVGLKIAPATQVNRLNFIEAIMDENSAESTDPSATTPLDLDAPNPELSVVYDYHRGSLSRYGGGAVTIDDHTFDEIVEDGIDAGAAAAGRIGRRVAKVQHLVACALLNASSTYLTSATGLGAISTDFDINLQKLILEQLNTDVVLKFGTVTHCTINQTTALKLLQNRSLSNFRGFAGKGSGGAFASQGAVLDGLPELTARFKQLFGVELLIDSVAMNIAGTARFGIDDGVINFHAANADRKRPSFLRTYCKNPGGIPKNLKSIGSIYSQRLGNPNRTVWWSETVLCVSSPKRTAANVKNPNGKQFSFT